MTEPDDPTQHSITQDTTMQNSTYTQQRNISTLNKQCWNTLSKPVKCKCYAFAKFGVSKYKFLKTNIFPCKLQKMQICENGDIMRMCITCSVYRFVCRRIVFLHKVTLPITGLAYIIQHFFMFLWICVNGIVFTTLLSVRKTFQKHKRKNFSIFSTSLSCKHP